MKKFCNVAWDMGVTEQNVQDLNVFTLIKMICSFLVTAYSRFESEADKENSTCSSAKSFGGWCLSYSTTHFTLTCESHMSCE